MMKILKNAEVLFIVVFFVFAIVSCDKSNSAKTENTDGGSSESLGNNAEKTEDEKPVSAEQTGYAFGVIVAKTVTESGIKLNAKELLKGYKAATKDGFKEEKFMEAEKILQKAFQDAHKRKVEEKSEISKKFLEENKKKEGVVTTDSGLQYEILAEGSGDKTPVAADTVEVNYEGKLMDGSVFDSSAVTGKPIKLKLSQVIPGWVEGIQLMKKGSKFKFYIPPTLAYGEQGISQGGKSVIPPNEVLTFEIELISINPVEK